MRVSKIICDRCKMEIHGNPILIEPVFRDRNSGEIAPDLINGAEDQMNKDYCLDCARQVLGFLNSPYTERACKPKEETEAEKAMKPVKLERTAEENRKLVKELILKGTPRPEVLKITGCVPAYYDNTKYQMKKKGLIPSESTEQIGVKCSEVKDSCVYRSKNGNTCDYCIIAGHSRGCDTEACVVYKKK